MHYINKKHNFLLTFYNICYNVLHSNLSLGRICYAAHSCHHAEDVVTVSIHSDLGSRGSSNSSRGEHQLESGVIDSGEVARSGRLMFLRSQSKGVHVNTGVRVASVMLEGLHNVKVRAFALGEAVLAVKLKLGNNDGVLAPAVHVEGGLGEHEGAGVGQSRTSGSSGFRIKNTSGPLLIGVHRTTRDGISGTRHLEDTTGDEGVGARGLGGATENVDGRGESINGVGVVEGLGTEDLEEDRVGLEGGAVIHVGVGLNNPDQLLAGVVEVDLDLVGRGTNRLVAGVLELLNEVLVGVLGHLAALVSVEEDEVDIDGGSNKGLLVGLGDGLGGGITGGQSGHSPEALTNGAEIDVNLDFVILHFTIPHLSVYLLALLY